MKFVKCQFAKSTLFSEKMTNHIFTRFVAVLMRQREQLEKFADFAERVCALSLVLNIGLRLKMKFLEL